MIEVICGACGTTHRFADRDVPPGGKSVACTRCKARIQVPGHAAGADLLSFDLGEPALAGGTGDVIDLAELPVPKRPGGSPPVRPAVAVTGPPPVSTPIPRIDLDALVAGVTESVRSAPAAMPKPDVKLPPIPAIKPPPVPARPGTPPPVRPAGPAGAKAPPLDFDLPAPVGPASTKGIVDLPAPVGPASTKGIVDLPAPVGPASSKGIVDLPTPVGPASSKGIVDLPTPVGPSSSKGIVDLPTPVGPASSKGIVDLPTPVGPASSKGIVDLPTPVGPASSKGIVDLPTPVGPSARAGGAARPAVPAARAATPPPVASPPARPAVPAIPPIVPPVGGSTVRGMTPLDPVRPAAAKPIDLLDDLDAALTPSAIGLEDDPPPGDIDLPVPKGFFDDLPQPATAADPDLLTPVGPVPSGELPAPKGFFDDLPQPANHGTRANLPAPAARGFFDDGPGRAPPGGGFFDDAPPAGGGGFFDDAPAGSRAMDLDDLDLAPPSASPSAAPPLDFGTALGPSGPGAGAPPPFDLDGDGGGSLDLGAPLAAPPAYSMPGAVRDPVLSPPPASSAPSPRSAIRGPMGGTLDLDAAAPVPALELPETGPELGGLDLPAPSTEGAGGGVVSFKPVSRAIPNAGMPSAGGAFDLDIDESKAKPKPVTRSMPVRPGASAAGAAGPTSVAATRRRRRIIAIAGLVIAAALAGGGYGYYRWQTEQERVARIDSDLEQARRMIAEGSAGHWKRAASFAEHARTLDADNVAAAALAAQAHLAGYLDEGTDGKNRLVAGGDLVQTLVASGKREPDADKALALKATIDGQTERAIQRLDGVLRVNANDMDALLYLAWARAAAGDARGAIEAFDRALPRAKKRDIPLYYGRGQAKLSLGDRDGARADFAAVIDRDKDHVGAQVGLAAAAPPADFARRETDLLALLERKDIAKADARAVVRAWTLAGDDARRAGRLDAARDRYRRALALQPGAVPAIVGEAETELRDGNLEAAAAAVDRALRKSSDDIGANLVAAEIDLRRGKIAEAKTRIEQLRTRQPPIQSPQDAARLLLLVGAVLENEPGKEPEALAAYDEARTLLGTTDVAPSIAAARLLARLAEKASGAEASDYRKRADALLAPLAAQAEADPTTAIALGVAYLAADDPGRAETWLRRSIATRPTDVEGRFQLAAALDKLGRHDEALTTYRGAFDLDPSRVDIGLALARSYEESGKTADASTMYQKLIAGTDVSLEVRIRAGRFWARTGDIARARVQGKAIHDADPENPGGLFLEAEGLYADKRYAEAKRFYQQAVDEAEEPQFLDGLGRSAEMLGAMQGDSRYKDEALRAYTRANEIDPKLLSSLVGRGRLLLERREAPKALTALTAANEIKPGDADVQYGIGVAHQEMGNRKDAVTWITRSVATRPRAEAYYRLGFLHYDLERPREAAEALTSATSLATEDERKTGAMVPWLTDALYLLGSIENTMRHDAQARRAWEQYLTRNPTNKTQEAEVKRTMLGLRGR